MPNATTSLPIVAESRLRLAPSPLSPRQEPEPCVRVRPAPGHPDFVIVTLHSSKGEFLHEGISHRSFWEFTADATPIAIEHWEAAHRRPSLVP